MCNDGPRIKELAAQTITYAITTLSLCLSLSAESKKQLGSSFALPVVLEVQPPWRSARHLLALKSSSWAVHKVLTLVWGGHKLLDDGGDIQIPRKRGWRFVSGCGISSLLDRKILSGVQLPLVLWRWHVGLMSQKIK